MRKVTLIMAAVVAVLLGGGLPFSRIEVLADVQKITAARKKLESIDKRLNQSYADLRSKRSREEDLRQDLAFVEEILEKYDQRLTALEEEAREGLKAIKRKQDEIHLMEAAIGKTEEQIRRRLSALYKSDQATLIKLFFSSESPSTLIENFVYFEKIVQRDKIVLAAYREDHQHLKTGLDKLKKLQERQQAVLEETLAAKKEQEEVRQLKKRLLAQTSAEKKRLAQTITALKKQGRQLNALIGRLKEEQKREYRSVKGKFSKRRGKLDWPVTGEIKVGFGKWRHPELDTLYESQGIEIEAPPDQPIAAVWDGNVVFSSPFKGYGNLLIINHGEGFYSLYGHASRLMKKVGETVEKGETIAFSGFENKDSIYFEIRHRGIPLDPTKWLLPK